MIDQFDKAMVSDLRHLADFIEKHGLHGIIDGSVPLQIIAHLTIYWMGGVDEDENPADRFDKLGTLLKEIAKCGPRVKV